MTLEWLCVCIFQLSGLFVALVFVVVVVESKQLANSLFRFTQLLCVQLFGFLCLPVVCFGKKSLLGAEEQETLQSGAGKLACHEQRASTGAPFDSTPMPIKANYNSIDAAIVVAAVSAVAELVSELVGELACQKQQQPVDESRRNRSRLAAQLRYSSRCFVFLLLLLLLLLSFVKMTCFLLSLLLV